MLPAPILSRARLESLPVDAIAYGAKDTGGMGGGAAGAVLVAAGREIQRDLRERLAHTPRQVGTVVVTESFRLAPRGIRWVCHLVSILQHTPQGAWCPHPGKLREGVAESLRRVHRLGGNSLAFSCLGTGEGRVPPAEAARLMMAGVRDFERAFPEANLQVIFALPSDRDFQAFQAHLGEAGRVQGNSSPRPSTAKAPAPVVYNLDEPVEEPIDEPESQR